MRPLTGALGGLSEGERPMAQRLICCGLDVRPFILAASSMETDKLTLLRRAMDTYVQRRQALSSNIANLDTPGYNRLSVSFEEQLREVRRRPEGLRQVEQVAPRMEVEEEQAPILEDELMGLADTQMRTELASRALREHFDLVRTGITGRAG